MTTPDTQALAASLARYAELSNELEQARESFSILPIEKCMQGGNRIADAVDVLCNEAVAMASDLRLMQGVIAELVGALEKCYDLFSDIQNNWSDPRSECRAGRDVIVKAIVLAEPLAELGKEGE